MGVEGAHNPMPGPSTGFIAFDDGAVVYYGREDGSHVVPMLQLEGWSVSRVRW
jgi:hypothetical protein